MPYIVTHRIGDEQRQRDASRLDADGHRGEAFQLLAAPPSVLYREAFASLEEVERTLEGEDFFNVAEVAGMPDDMGRSSQVEGEVDAMLASVVSVDGGRVKLPDGSVIEVDAEEWTALVDAIEPGEGIPVRGTAGARWPTPEQKRAIRAAWNAEHGIGLGARA